MMIPIIDIFYSETKVSSKQMTFKIYLENTDAYILVAVILIKENFPEKNILISCD